MSGSERVNTRLGGSAPADSTKVLAAGELRGLTKLIKLTEDEQRYAAEQGLTEMQHSPLGGGEVAGVHGERRGGLCLCETTN